MPIPALTLLSIALFAAAPVDEIAPGTVLAYRGQVRQRSTEGETPPEKQFDLTLLVAEKNDQSHDVYWLIDEAGRGGWPWIERCGRVTADAYGREADDRAPSLLYELDEDVAVIPLIVPLLRPPVAAMADANWTADKLTYTFVEEAELDGRAIWNVQVNNAYGTKRRLALSKSSPLVTAIAERVFMGMGTEYELSFKLVNVEQLPVERFDAERRAFDALLELRQALNRPARTQTAAWSESDRKILAERLPGVQMAAATTRLQRLAEGAGRDVARQDERAVSVEQLVEKFEGQPVEDFQVGGLDRTRAYSQDMRGKLTLLHFWEYRDAPLKEPYGQVGYLEFLQERHKSNGLAVYGVAVDSRLDDPQYRGEAIRGVRKLKQFMNLSYPILLDGGALIRQFGDPRTAGAELPLFVLIDSEGKILEYHVGHYEVDREAGLKELDAEVQRAVKRNN
ncbi:MAG: TlpA family protein disulfide reductase [Pirellulales bacterium]|nr:TlpA family protein disulfide reductase [Pirellulales bacterium]